MSTDTLAQRAPTQGLPRGVEARQQRTGGFVRASLDKDKRTVELAFSSEEPVERYWGLEVLGHAPGEMDNAWIGGGTAPLLLDHDTRQQIGVVERVAIGTDRKARAVVRFGRGARAEEAMQDVADGIRANVSVGYEILTAILVKEEQGKPSTYRVTRWRPLEVSLVSIPADMTVGIGRQAGAPAQPTMRTSTMHDEQRAAHPPGTTKEQADILALGELAGEQEAAKDAILRGDTVEHFRREVLSRRQGRQQPLGSFGSGGLAEGDPDLRREVAARYSLVRAVRALADPRAAREAGFEFEVSTELKRRSGRDPGKGLMVPMDLPMRGNTRAMTFGGTGSSLVQTDVLGDQFIDVLRARLYTVAAGATMLDGLVGNVAIPRKTASVTASWIAGDDADSIANTDATLNQVSLTPKVLGALTTISHRMLVQTSYGVEQMLRQDLADTLAAELDRVALAGTGTAPQPRGVLNTAGIGAATFATGTTPTYAQVLAMETQADAAGMDRRAYIMSPTMRQRFKAAEIIASSGRMIWETPDNARPGEGRVNGYSAWATANLGAQEVLFGNWSDLIIGTWGTLMIDADPGGTNFARGSVSLRAMIDADVAVRYAAAFAKLTI